MGKVPQWITSKALSMVENSAEEKLDMFKAGKETDAVLDKSILGEKNSERLQRGLITKKFMDFIRGLWAESPALFVKMLRDYADKAENNTAGGH